jgi:hypothetical protein
MMRGSCSWPSSWQWPQSRQRNYSSGYGAPSDSPRVLVLSSPCGRPQSNSPAISRSPRPVDHPSAEGFSFCRCADCPVSHGGEVTEARAAGTRKR